MYPPLNRCIYCGTVEDPLSREHIIPYALGGKLVIPRASCPEHASITSQVELEVTRMGYGYHRATVGAPTRRPGRHAEVLSSTVEVSGKDPSGATVTRTVPIAQIPPYQVIPRLSPPGVLAGRPAGADGSFRLETHIPESNPLRRLRERLGLIEICSPVRSFPFTPFARMLAKIAHCFAVAELGSSAFSSRLLPLILGEPDTQFYLVGELDPVERQSKSALRHRVVEVNDERWLVVEISLHILPHLPRYQVACGVLE